MDTAQDPGDVQHLAELLRQAVVQLEDRERSSLDEALSTLRDTKDSGTKKRRRRGRRHRQSCQRAAEAPLPWHSRRRPSRLAERAPGRGQQSQGEGRRRGEGVLDDRSNKLSPVLHRDAHCRESRAKKQSVCLGGMNVHASPSDDSAQLVSSLADAVWWTTHGTEGLPCSSKAVFAYQEQRAGEPGTRVHPPR